MIEVADERDAIRLDARADVQTPWLWRGAIPAGTSAALVEAVRTLPLVASTYVWGAGEANAVTAVRRDLLDDRRLPRELVSMTGYWRRVPHPLTSRRSR